jgi:hypothetical protein
MQQSYEVLVLQNGEGSDGERNRKCSDELLVPGLYEIEVAYIHKYSPDNPVNFAMLASYADLPSFDQPQPMDEVGSLMHNFYHLSDGTP